MQKRFFCVFLAVLFLFSACKSGSADDRAKAAREDAVREVNRYRFAPSDDAFPEGYAVCPVAPYVDGDGNITLALQEETYENGEYSVAALRLKTVLVTVAADGALLREETVPLPENTSVLCGVLGENTFHFAATSWGAGHASSFVRFDREAQEISGTTMFRDLKELASDAMPVSMAEDADGNLYLIGESRRSILSLNSAYADPVEFRSRETLSALVTDAEGNVYALTSGADKCSLARADRTTGTLAEPQTVNADSASGVQLLGDWLYFASKDGVRRVSLSAGKGESEKVLDYAASGILTETSLEGYAVFIGMIDEETALFAERRKDPSGVWKRLPRIYRKLSGEQADDCRVIQVAYACELEDAVRSAFVLFNQAHDDMRIVLLDYGSYGNALNGDYGSWKMITDIVNGQIFPDLVIDRRTVYEDDEFDLSPMKQLTDAGLTADLAGFLDRDPVVNRENLFGCVLRAFSDGDGGVWGIAPYFGLRMWLSTPELLNGYAADGRWTVGTFLDYWDGLPEDSVPCLWCTSDLWANGLLSDLASYYDADSGKCRFDSPEFIRCLKILASLPDNEQYARESPFAAVSPAALTPQFRDGTIRLSSVFLYGYGAWMNLASTFGTEDFRLVGYPSHEPSGARFESDLVFMICRDSPDPEAAWELIRSFFLDENLSLGEQREQSVSLPALKSSFDKQTEVWAAMTILRDQDGVLHYWEDPSLADTSRMNGNYTEEVFDRALAERIRQYLDEEGAPILEQTPGMVKTIVAEELSALRAGHGSAEDCAAKIQSRVSIWLAEQK
ncbi:MAG: hypothetical protein IK132_03855 [Clostridia bacterium]|nr:hypothetical protein [Clostridia bacterium]